ncbi:D-alanyl-D-alanine carboxypeptidase family protein, partial [Candidatus Roizmanbacteria bacterium]|nr:D-alanyl-D-alanine carboxypeptidase family protein [Candidatus Roizmanbacteria bacterium]
MAGGEFCGNATRSAAWEYLQGKPGKIKIFVSGATTPLIAGVLNNGEVFTQMPVYKNPEKIKKLSKTKFLVKMEGIIHLVIFGTGKIIGCSSEKIKQIAKAEIDSRGLQLLPAVGVIYIDSTPNKISIIPIVYVRDINTLYYETGCASGTTAVGLVLAKYKNKSITDLPVWQPSGLPIKISVNFEKQKFIYAQIQGPFEKLTTGTLKREDINLSKIKQPTIQDLEKKMIRYQDLKSVSVVETNQQFVYLDPTIVPNGYTRSMNDMESITGSIIVIRKDVATKLINAQNLLLDINPNYTLFVTYGYRSLKIQIKNFLEQLKKIKTFYYNPLDLYEEAHRFIAVPNVAGHPTGGAVDIIIKDKKTSQIINFGGKQYDFKTKNCYVFYTKISDDAKRNRLLLRKIMMEVGFAPFDGEWWHFSYGDREWSRFYKKPNAIFNQQIINKRVWCKTKYRLCPQSKIVSTYEKSKPDKHFLQSLKFPAFPLFPNDTL